MQEFHFIRAQWLLALLPLFIICILFLKRKLFSRSWQSFVDPALLPHLLIGKPGKASHAPLVLFFIGGCLGILALAGPAWEKLPQPVFQKNTALVIALDLSRSMDAADIQPSRLVRAQHKISDILRQRKEGQTALIVYTTGAFTVSPLTDDADTIEAMVPSLKTEIMPSQGSHTASALARSNELLAHAGIHQGDILLITDGIDASANDALSEIKHRVSILALGSAEGAPIALDNGGFLKDQDGSIVIAKLDAAKLETFARQAKGRFSLLSNDDSDINYLLAPLDANRIDSDSEKTDINADTWKEMGPWLLLLLLPLAAFAFRKGLVFILFIVILPLPDNAQAFEWNSLWQNSNQRARQQLEQGQVAEAAQLFSDPAWKAAAQYKAGDYEASLQQLEAIKNSSADTDYNRGNALAQLGRVDEALDAYNRALEKDPQHEDARYNRELLEKNKQQQDENKESDKNSDDKQSDKNKSDDQQQQSKDSKPADNKSADEQQQKDAPQDKQQQAGEDDKPEPQDRQQQANKDLQQQAEQDDKQEAEAAMEQSQQQLSEQAKQQWLRRIPDDPGGLLRNKFYYQYKQQHKQSNTTQPW
ncbi:MAG: VWA domain-containing protein [Gammaproteobacteria bacterium]|nr:VWA domain-containing protein [Gammaproteobacteria bacterium]